MIFSKQVNYLCCLIESNMCAFRYEIMCEKRDRNRVFMNALSCECSGEKQTEQ